MNVQTRKLRDLAPTVLILVLAAAGISAELHAQEPSPPPQRQGRPASRIWWNQPRHIEPLKLTAELRQAMDERFATHLDERRRQGQRYLALRKEMGELLAAGKWEEARAKAAQASEVFAGISRAEAEMVVEVIQLLTPEQRNRLREEFPRLLSRPWLAGGFGRPSSGPGQRPRRREREEQTPP